MSKRIGKNKSDPESRAFWAAIEESVKDRSRVVTTEREPWTHELERKPAPPKRGAHRRREPSH